MADKQIKDLPIKLTSDDTDQFALDNAAGVTYKTDKATLFEDITDELAITNDVVSANGVVSGMLLSINTDNTN